MLIKINNEYVEHTAIVNIYPEDVVEDTDVIFRAIVVFTVGSESLNVEVDFESYKKRDAFIEEIVSKVNELNREME